MKTAARVIAFAGLACIVWTAVGTGMLLVPHSPHYEMLRSMHALDSFYQSYPDSSKAAEAFDEFLRIGDRAHIVESTLLPVCAAIAVTLLSLWLLPLSLTEFGLVVGGFALWLTVRMGIQYVGLLDALGVAVFAAALWTGRIWARRLLARRMAAR